MNHIKMFYLRYLVMELGLHVVFMEQVTLLAESTHNPYIRRIAKTLIKAGRSNIDEIRRKLKSFSDSLNKGDE